MYEISRSEWSIAVWWHSRRDQAIRPSHNFFLHRVHQQCPHWPTVDQPGHDGKSWNWYFRNARNLNQTKRKIILMHQWHHHSIKLSGSQQWQHCRMSRKTRFLRFIPLQEQRQMHKWLGQLCLHVQATVDRQKLRYSRRQGLWNGARIRTVIPTRTFTHPVAVADVLVFPHSLSQWNSLKCQDGWRQRRLSDRHSRWNHCLCSSWNCTRFKSHNDQW